MRRPALKGPAPGSFDRLAEPGDTLLVLGAPWNRERYSDTARWLRDERRIRFGVLVHDLVPIRHPEWCHRGVPRMFREWYADVLPFCDVVFANSRHTAGDVEAWGAGERHGAERPRPAAPGGQRLRRPGACHAAGRAAHPWQLRAVRLDHGGAQEPCVAGPRLDQAARRGRRRDTRRRQRARPRLRGSHRLARRRPAGSTRQH